MQSNFLNLAARFQAELKPVALKTDGKTPAIYIYGPIFEGGADAKSLLLALSEVGKVKNLEVHFNSNGGDVFESRAMGAVLRAHGSNITAYIDGLAASAAGELALTIGERVVMARGSFLMLHEASMFGFGNKHDLRKAADVLDQVDTTLIDSYARKTGMKAAKINEMLTAETWLSAQDALAGGWADAVEGERVTNSFDLSFYASAPKELLNQEPKKGAILDALLMPANAKEAPADYAVGDRVKVKEGKEHDHMTMGKAGEIVEISTPALAIKFDGMKEPHKWYVADEVEPENPQNKKKEKRMTHTATADISAAVDAALATKETETQTRISAAVKLASESAVATATLAERNRMLAINKLAQPGFEAELKAALDGGQLPEAFALAVMTASKDRGITLGGMRNDAPPAAPHASAPNPQAAKPGSAWDATIAKYTPPK